MTKEGTLIRSALFIFSKRLQQRSFAPAYLRALPLHPDFIHQQPQIAVAKARRAVAELPPQRLAEGGQGFRIQRVELHETLSALISHSGCDKGQLARLVGGLRERGLLDGRADENDRRNLLLHLTPGGAEVITDSLRIQKQQLSSLAVQGFSGEEENTLASLLNRLLQNLEDPPR